VNAALWFFIIGLLLCGMAMLGSYIERLPLTTSLLYVATGAVLGPLGFGVLLLNPIKHSAALELASKVAVLLSLFVAGLKLRSALTHRRWHLPVRLATMTMTVTVVLVALLGMYGLGLSVGAAVLLAGILAPTDPVLASDVTVESAADRDRLRFALTGEAGLNDGTAFPFVMLGLGLLGLHEIGPYGVRWLAVDVAWGIGAGLATGAALGTATGRVVLFLRTRKKEAVGLDDLLALGLIALSYGVAELLHGYGFLAVFAAGLALRRIERTETGAAEPPPDVAAAALAAATGDAVDAVATSEETAHAYMAEAALGFTEQIERVASVGVVLVMGSMLTRATFDLNAWWFVLALFLIVRPLAVLFTTHVRNSAPSQRPLICWFGIRGVGSVYYLMYALQHGVRGELAQQLTALTFTVVASSAVLHGISVTPLMKRYNRLRKQQALTE